MQNLTDKAKKTISPETKAKIAAKRKANPQFAHIQSSVRKAQENEKLQDAQKTLLDSKKTLSNWKVLDGKEILSNIENEAFLSKCKTFINFATKDANKATLDNFAKLAKVNKKGLYSVYNFEQNVQKVVKLTVKKGFSYDEAINYLLAK